MVSILTYLVRRLGAPPSPAALAALSLVALTVCSMAGDQMIRPLAALVSWLASRKGARSLGGDGLGVLLAARVVPLPLGQQQPSEPRRLLTAPVKV